MGCGALWGVSGWAQQEQNPAAGHAGKCVCLLCAGDYCAGLVHSFDGGHEELAALLANPRLSIGLNGCSVKTGAGGSGAAARAAAAMRPPTPRLAGWLSPQRASSSHFRSKHPSPSLPPSLPAADNLAVAVAVPLGRLLLETDAPWCEVRPSHAGAAHVHTRPRALDRKKHDPAAMVKSRNEPANILQVAEAVAGAREGLAVEALAAAAYANSLAIFFPGEAAAPAAPGGAAAAEAAA